MAYAQQQDSSVEHIQIVVAQITPPPGPNKPGRIKDTAGNNFGIWPDKMANVREGETYDVEFIQNGAYRNIRSIRVATPPAPAPRQFTAQHQPQARSLSSAATQPSDSSVSRNGQYYRPTSPRDAERMMVCSTLNAFIQTGRINCERSHLIEAINELRAAWQMTFGSDAE